LIWYRLFGLVWSSFGFPVDFFTYVGVECPARLFD